MGMSNRTSAIKNLLINCDVLRKKLNWKKGRGNCNGGWVAKKGGGGGLVAKGRGYGWLRRGGWVAEGGIGGIGGGWVAKEGDGWLRRGWGG
jgi:hypothetical protein